MPTTLVNPRTWQLGAKSLLLHPLRSLLTVLGIFIGTASVIWLLAIGEGISRKAQEQIAGLGADNIIVRTVKPPAEKLSTTDFFLEYGIKREDCRRLKDTIPTIDNMLQIRELRRVARFGPREIDIRLVGCEPLYARLNRLNPARGRFLSELDAEENVCVLASGTAARLFPIEEPVGKTIRVESDVYRVVGVTRLRTPTAGIGGSLSSQDFNYDVYVPIQTLWERIGDQVVQRQGGSRTGEIIELSQLTLHVADLKDVEATAEVVRLTLDRYHPKEDYGVVVPLELLRQAETTRLMFMLFMGLIAAISLVVGGIGIMNIMLATVTERTREIGIRRALGARRGDITRQFLVETTLLSVIGGVTGILGGITCGPLIELSRETLQQAAPSLIDDLPEVIRTMEPTIVPFSIPLAFCISVGVGVIFGLYPALRAAKMDPIEALRHE